MNVNRLTDEGDLRRAAHAGYDLLINYAQPSENRVVDATRRDATRLYT